MEIINKIEKQNGYATQIDLWKLASEYIKHFGYEYRKGSMNEYFNKNREDEFIYMYEKLKELNIQNDLERV